MAERQPSKTAFSTQNSGELSPRQVADQLGVDEKSVRSWAAAGLIETRRTTAGRYRLPASVVPMLKQLAEHIPLNARELKRHLRSQPAPTAASLKEDR